jgi:hypothetical protein
MEACDVVCCSCDVLTVSWLVLASTRAVAIRIWVVLWVSCDVLCVS